MRLKPVVLSGRFVRLEPLKLAHAPALIEVGMEPAIWKWTANVVRNSSDIERYVRLALEDQASGGALPFATIDINSNKVVGATRFGNIDVDNRKVEIGWTWINPRWQRSAINTEAKLLMLTHAFKVWDCIRVELKTDANNMQSRTAMLRIGCVEEGTLRNHMIVESGRFRDSVYFSIIDSEWESVESKLQLMLTAQV
ncbi:MAG: GNAT family protein [Pyrinomonadaceae bacterium]